MGILIAYPKNKKELTTLKAFMNALEIRFEETESPYSFEFIEKINRSKEDFETGKFKSIKSDNLFNELQG